MNQTLTVEFYEPQTKEMVACFESGSFNLSVTPQTYETPVGEVLTVSTVHHFDMLIEKTIKDGQINPDLVVRYYIDGVPDKRINFLKLVNTEVQNGIAGARLLFDVRMIDGHILNGFQ